MKKSKPSVRTGIFSQICNVRQDFTYLKTATPIRLKTPLPKLPAEAITRVTYIIKCPVSLSPFSANHHMEQGIEKGVSESRDSVHPYLDYILNKCFTCKYRHRNYSCVSNQFCSPSFSISSTAFSLQYRSSSSSFRYALRIS